MSLQYDKKRQDMIFTPKDKVYITMGKFGQPGYKLPSTGKLSEQQVGPFDVIEQVGKLAYRLDIPPNWKIHPVISVAHLERHVPDPFNRSIMPLPETIHDDDDGSHDEWEVEEIIRSRWTGKGRNKRKEWRVKWKGFGPEHDTWEPAENLINAKEHLDTFEAAANPVFIGSTFILPAEKTAPTLPYYKSDILDNWLSSDKRRF